MTMREFETPGPITVDLDVGIGSVRILASDRTVTTVDVQPRDESKPADRKAAELARVELNGAALSVRALKTWRRYTPVNDGAIEVTIELPAGSDVTGHTDLGDCQAEGRLGDCRLKSAMGRLWVDEARSVHLGTSFGDVTVGSCSGNSVVTTSSGRIRVDRIDGPALVKNSNGDTWIGRASQHVRVRAANGDIAVDRALGSVTAKTANGGIRIGEVVRGQIELRSAAGDIEIGVRDGSAVWLDVGSRYGTVRNGLSAGEPPQPAAEVAEIHATTSYGDVVLTRVAGGAAAAPLAGTTETE